MKAEHRRPLIAFVLVTVVCFGMIAHAIRTDALGGLGHLDPSRILAARLLVQKAPDAPGDAPVLTPPTASERIPTAPTTPSHTATATGPAHGDRVRHEAGAHTVAAQVSAPAVTDEPVAQPNPSTPAVPVVPPTSHTPQHHGTDGWPGGLVEDAPTPGSDPTPGPEDPLEHTSHGWGQDHGQDHGWGQDEDHGWGHDHGWGQDEDHGHGGWGHDDDHDDHGHGGWGHGWGHDSGHGWGH